MCERAATSDEHVPPKCIFPEMKDAGVNLRKELITVPSCDLHNGKKSADDEFLMVSLAGIIGSNSIGYNHKFTKVVRSIKRTSFRILMDAMKNQSVHWVEVAPNKFIDVIWGTPDFQRLEKCFDHMVRGLHYHHFGRKFLGETSTLLGYTHDQEHNPAEFKRFIKAKVEEELRGKERLGNNPDVFTYQFTEPAEYGIFLAHLQFYGGLNIYVSLSPMKIKDIPKTLPMMLMERGITTHIQLGSEVYTFNQRPLSEQNETPAENS